MLTRDVQRAHTDRRLAPGKHPKAATATVRAQRKAADDEARRLVREKRRPDVTRDNARFGRPV